MLRRPVIDGLEFARAGSKLALEWPASGFPRLADLLYSEAGSVSCRLEGIPEYRGHPALRLELGGTLQLVCQRCLGELSFPLAVSSMLVMGRTQAQIDAEPVGPEGADWVLAQKEMQLHALAEDELLLALPLAPRHEACSAGEVRPDAGRQSPFAGLRRLAQGRRN